jgi:dTDP-4-dehydrorhamnose 3,5-epimerase
MKVTRFDIDGPLLIEPAVREDSRGFFAERFHAGQFQELGLPAHFVQDNHSHSNPGVLRGLHFQYEPPQGKLVGVIAGKIFDVVVDIRHGSPTFGKKIECELSGSNRMSLWIPPGFAHGFCVIGDEPADVVYKVDVYYNPEGEGGIHWADRELAIRWPVSNPMVSEKDQNLSGFVAYRANPVDWRRI